MPDQSQTRERWTNAEITLTVPLDVPVDVDPVAKQEAVAGVMDRVIAALPAELAEHVAAGRWCDMPEPSAPSPSLGDSVLVSVDDAKHLLPLLRGTLRESFVGTDEQFERFLDHHPLGGLLLDLQCLVEAADRRSA